MSVSEDNVRKVARLARIQVPEEELPALAAELGTILDWIEQLNEVDIASVPPMASAAGIPLVLRDDVARDETPRRDILSNAPDARHHCFAIPKVVE